MPRLAGIALTIVVLFYFKLPGWTSFNIDPTRYWVISEDIELLEEDGLSKKRLELISSSKELFRKCTKWSSLWLEGVPVEVLRYLAQVSHAPSFASDRRYEYPDEVENDAADDHNGPSIGMGSIS